MELHWAYKHIRQVEHDAKAKMFLTKPIIYLYCRLYIPKGEIIIMFVAQIIGH